jgi:GntR family transcriptional regulator
MRGIKIDKESPVPLYLQLAELLRCQINTGALKPNEMLPPERVLCEIHEVSRATVREAINQLKNEKLVATQRGAGNFVKRAEKVERNLLGVHDFDMQIEAGGHTNDVEVIGFDADYHSPSAISRLGHAGEHVIKVTRLRRADGEPLFIEKIYLPKSLFPNLVAADFTSTNIFSSKITQEYGLAIGDITLQIEPVLLNDDEAEMLGVEKLPAAGLLNERTTYDQQGRPIVFSKWLFSGNRCRHVLKIKPK